MKRALLAAAFLALPAEGAETEKLALGSLDLQPCPNAKGRERATLFLEISAPNFRRVQDELRECAALGVKAATLPALLKNLPAAQAEFWVEFRMCSRYTEWADANLSVKTACRLQ